ncbi:MAG: single-stranded-DNA-specific exonuclease RecJ [Candidatus Dadabacteria bacterium]|nr:MAG: single-stranded-DNA-specific exonuclease RecJ [Candidatus Dadabacteria bacterium]
MLQYPPDRDVSKPADGGADLSENTAGLGQDRLLEQFKPEVEVEAPNFRGNQAKRIRDTAYRIRKKFGVSVVTSRLLAVRGFGANKSLEKHLSPALEHLPDPAKLKNLERAAEEIAGAVLRGESVAICCDYDVDGTSSAAILSRFLEAVGGQGAVFAPDRFKDGYGLNNKMVEDIASSPDAFKLLVTLDYGTKNETELSLASKLGLKTIVIDHHHKPEGAETAGDVMVNPKQEGCGFAGEILCTAGLSWYLVNAIREKLISFGDRDIAKKASEFSTDQLLPFVALATVADVVPLVGANHTLTALGMRELERTEIVGLKALLEAGRLSDDIRAEHIAFRLGPMINAAGRVLSEAQEGRPGALFVVELMTTGDFDRARELASMLFKANQERKEVERNMKAQALKLARDEIARFGGLPSAFVLYDSSFHEGVVGITAARLVEQFNRPVIILSKDQDGNLKGSGRAPEGVHLAEILEELKNDLLKGGGHAKAAGLTLPEENLERFRSHFIEACERALADMPAALKVRADLKITLSELKQSGSVLYDELKKLEPFGEANPAPRFLVENVQIVLVEDLGASSQSSGHKKFILRQSSKDGTDTYLTAVWWHSSDQTVLKEGDVIDLVFQPARRKGLRFHLNREDLVLNINAAVKKNN